MGEFHTFDFIVAGIVAASAILAFMHGFVREVLGIGTWVGAGAIAVIGYPTAREVAGAYIPSPLIADVAAGALLFVGAFLILAILSRAISRALESADGLGPLNRSLGLLFGLLRGALIVTVAYLALSWTIQEKDHPTWIAEARSTPLLKETSAMLEGFMPAEWRAKGRDAAGDAARNVDIYDRLNAPQPGAPSQDPAGGYDQRHRDAMDDLIRNQQ